MVPGTATDIGPITLALSTTDGQPKKPISLPPIWYISGVAAEAETIGYDTTDARGWPGTWMTINPPPPMPFIHGSTTDATNDVVTAASTALPPLESTAAP